MFANLLQTPAQLILDYGLVQTVFTLATHDEGLPFTAFPDLPGHDPTTHLLIPPETTTQCHPPNGASMVIHW